MAALTLCLSGALYFVHQKSPSPRWDSVLFANVVLSLPLLAVVGISFALNNLYAKAPGQVLKSSFSELHDIIYGLGIAGFLIGLGFEPFKAAAICLLANTAPVAFGSLAVPITTLAGLTGLPVERLSASVGRICGP